MDAKINRKEIRREFHMVAVSVTEFHTQRVSGGEGQKKIESQEDVLRNVNEKGSIHRRNANWIDHTLEETDYKTIPSREKNGCIARSWNRKYPVDR